MKRSSVITISLVAAFVLLTGKASATTFVVNTVNDPGTGGCDASECTFREALAAANTGGVRDDTITFTVSGFISALGTPFPTIQSAATQGKLAIEGPGAAALSIRRSFGNFGILNNSIGANTTISDLTITGGAATAGAGGGVFNFGTLLLERVAILDNNANGGGGLSNDNNATLTLRRSLVAGNTSNPNSQGAGIYSIGTLDIDRSTITDNRQLGTGGADFGGGIASFGTTKITDSTIAGNSSVNGSNITATSGTATLTNTIVADPTRSNAGNSVNCAGTFIVSAGFNLSDDNTCALTQPTDLPGVEPALGTLGDNGGPTETMALLQTSPAVDAGNDTTASGTDQRGLPRPSDFPDEANVADGSDIGAFELQVPPPTGGGGGGGDAATCSGVTATIAGTDGVDRIRGTSGADVIAALGGDDIVNGGRGEDLICGGDGKDKLKGGPGKDRLLGEAGKDRLSGGSGTDTLVGGPSKDRCKASGKDKLKTC